MSTAYRLLVVEDEEPIAELLEYGLRQEGYTVRVALTRRGRYAPGGPGAA